MAAKPPFPFQSPAHGGAGEGKGKSWWSEAQAETFFVTVYCAVTGKRPNVGMSRQRPGDSDPQEGQDRRPQRSAARLGGGGGGGLVCFERRRLLRWRPAAAATTWLSVVLVADGDAGSLLRWRRRPYAVLTLLRRRRRCGCQSCLSLTEMRTTATMCADPTASCAGRDAACSLGIVVSEDHCCVRGYKE